MELINGSCFEFKSADNPDSLRGVGLDWLWIDEAAMLTDEAWQILYATTSDRKGAIWLTTTPRGLQSWLYERIWQESSQREDIEIFRFPTWANPHFPKDEIESARRNLSDYMFEQEYGAEFRGAGNRVYPDFDRRRHVLDSEFRPDPRLPIYVGIDFGWTSTLAFVFFQVTTSDDVVLFKELGFRHTSIADAAKPVKLWQQYDHTNVPTFNIVSMFCDPAGAAGHESMGTSSVAELRKAFEKTPVRVQFRTDKATREVLGGVRLVTEFIRNNKLKVSPNCTNCIAAFEGYQNEPPRAGLDGVELKPMKDGKHEHYMDAVRYFFVNKFPMSATSIGAANR